MRITTKNIVWSIIIGFGLMWVVLGTYDYYLFEYIMNIDTGYRFLSAFLGLISLIGLLISISLTVLIFYKIFISLKYRNKQYNFKTILQQCEYMSDKELKTLGNHCFYLRQRKDMKKNFWCKIGIHKWEYNTDMYRKCLNCDKEQDKGIDFVAPYYDGGVPWRTIKK